MSKWSAPTAKQRTGAEPFHTAGTALPFGMLIVAAGWEALAKPLATVGEIVCAVDSPPPLRTLNGRVRGMVTRGLVERAGARDAGRYRVVEGC